MGTIATIIQLITSVGIPAASQIISLWRKQDPANVAVGEWATLLEVLSKTPDDAISKIENK